MEKYNVAIYMRLSKAASDEKYQRESSSILTQRIMLTDYVHKNFIGYQIYEFADDGYSGTNFDRPAVKEMIELVKMSKIDCIVVKDFSRFSRDYIELGNYLENIFPFIGVRFISLNDNYDSDNYNRRAADIDVNFKSLLYDLYSKDLSRKVKSSIAVRRERGKYVSAHSPFGYKKSKEDCHMLIVENDEADIVRKIFDLTLRGNTSVQIAKLFNANNIKTPLQFRVEKGVVSKRPKGGNFLWMSSSVCQILNNRVYVGDIVYGKYERESVGGRRYVKPRDKWKIIYNHHEPIIDREDFFKIQDGRGNKSALKGDEMHYERCGLVGKIICGSCGRNLVYRNSVAPYFYCPHKYVSGNKNCVQKISVLFIEQYLLYKFGDAQWNSDTNYIIVDNENNVTLC